MTGQLFRLCQTGTLLLKFAKSGCKPLWSDALAELLSLLCSEEIASQQPNTKILVERVRSEAVQRLVCGLDNQHLFHPLSRNLRDVFRALPVAIINSVPSWSQSMQAKHPRSSKLSSWPRAILILIVHAFDCQLGST